MFSRSIIEDSRSRTEDSRRIIEDYRSIIDNSRSNLIKDTRVTPQLVASLIIVIYDCKFLQSRRLAIHCEVVVHARVVSFHKKGCSTFQRGLLLKR